VVDTLNGRYWSVLPIDDTHTTLAREVTVPTSGADSIIAFFQDPKVLAMLAAAAILSIVLIKLWNSVPKGVVLVIVLLALLFAGYLHA